MANEETKANALAVGETYFADVYNGVIEAILKAGGDNLGGVFDPVQAFQALAGVVASFGALSQDLKTPKDMREFADEFRGDILKWLKKPEDLAILSERLVVATAEIARMRGHAGKLN